MVENLSETGENDDLDQIGKVMTTPIQPPSSVPTGTLAPPTAPGSIGPGSLATTNAPGSIHPPTAPGSITLPAAQGSLAPPTAPENIASGSKGSEGRYVEATSKPPSSRTSLTVRTQPKSSQKIAKVNCLLFNSK